VIRKSHINNGLVKGLNEVCKALDRKEAVLCVLADNCDDPKYKKLITALRRVGLQPLSAIEEVNMFKSDGTVLNFTNPQVQAAVNANTFAIVGTPQTKSVAEMLPSVLGQLGPEALGDLKSWAEKLQATTGDKAAATAAGDDDVPDLVQNFDEAAKTE